MFYVLSSRTLARTASVAVLAACMAAVLQVGLTARLT
jgi:hypothetical protein